MEWFLFLGGTLIVISIILIRGRGRGSQAGPHRLEGSRPIGEIDTARMSSGRSVARGWPGENTMGAGRGIAGMGGNSPKVDSD